MQLKYLCILPSECVFLKMGRVTNDHRNKLYYEGIKKWLDPQKKVENTPL